MLLQCKAKASVFYSITGCGHDKMCVFFCFQAPKRGVKAPVPAKKKPVSGVSFLVGIVGLLPMKCSCDDLQLIILV